MPSVLKPDYVSGSIFGRTTDVRARGSEDSVTSWQQGCRFYWGMFEGC